VKIARVSRPDLNGEVTVTVEVSDSTNSLIGDDGRGNSSQSGAFDLRLFRDRQLVGVFPEDGAAKLRRLDVPNDNLGTSLNLWRNATEIPLDPTTKTRTINFTVRLPKGKDVSNIKFTGYAFNEDRVKSETAGFQWPAEQLGNLPKAEVPVKRRAFIISIGVNNFTLVDQLQFAASDAHLFQNEVVPRIRDTGSYEVIPLELVSETIGNTTIGTATKDNIKAVLDLLAGRPIPSTVKDKLPGASRIQKATPDDLVIITMSTHGYSIAKKDFYLAPVDITKQSLAQTAPDLSSMVSGEELSIWMRGIDSNEMVVIIDACQSAAAVEGMNFKPGSLGSRGFGQLAYDKRMKVLSATQATEYSYEDPEKIKHGLLTWALVKEGLMDGLADTGPEGKKDGKIMLREWLEFGESRVAPLSRSVSNGTYRGLIRRRLGKPTENEEERVFRIQRASLFDFSGKQDEIVISLMNKR
jgi:hypothetical protein